jgi:5-methylcytosine-specific restriction endonuclease McrA
MPHKTCPQCGKDFYNPASKVVCCSTKCQYERLNTQEIRTCKQCGNSFKVRKNSNKECCSVACRGMLQRKIDAKVIRECKRCGKTFEMWTYRNQVYCSMSCKNKHIKSPKRIREPAKLVTLECEWCHKQYTVHVAMNSNGRKSRFCSRSCRSEWVSKNNRGINHPRYIGGTKYADRGQNWFKQRKAAITRDNYKCQICGKKQGNKKRVLDVHHIKPFKDFNGDYISANELTNLITLCRHCHTQVEDHGLPCPRPML